MGWTHGRRWTDALVESEVRSAAESFGGRMPSAPELNAMGKGSLASLISRTPGGYKGWARRLGLEMKKSETLFGHEWEAYIHGLLTATGYESVRQTTRAPFDILVDGRVRLNVKAARWHAYGPCRGFFFGIGKTWQNCDAFALVKVSDKPPEVLWVPSSEAQQQTITLTGKHRLNACTDMAAVLGRRH